MIAIYIILGFFLVPLSLFVHFHWSSYRITSHPHVEPIHIALPSIADEIQLLVEKVSYIAQIPVPETYIFRSQLSNAFIIASTKSPHLFLSDELFEECNELGEEQGIEKLEWTICHEIAHIQHNDALPVYLIETVHALTTTLKLNKFSQLIDKWADTIEKRADTKANKLYQSICSPTKSNP